ncbi:MAG: cobalamin-dependent protein, partial [Saprospiraceae bacterium]
MESVKPYHPKHKIRLVTAASLFDGHDAAINIMRRILQASGAEVIHLGHNRSVQEIVTTAIQEDVQGIAITSYQGGHNEFFKYMYDLLQERGAGHIKIFGGGGGTILPAEIEELQKYGIARIYSPDDGRHMGLQGMINDLLQQCDFPTGTSLNGEILEFQKKDAVAIARMISAAENDTAIFETAIRPQLQAIFNKKPALKKTPVLGITGTGGAGKSSLVDEILRRFLIDFQDKTIAIISVDPSKRKSGGALLGDRIRMNAVNPDLASGRVFMRSLATRQSNVALSKHVQSALEILKAAGYDLIVLESSGIGQSDTEIVDYAGVSLYVMTPEFGAATQLEKIDMIDFADIVAINKFDKRGAMDALRDVRKQYQRAHTLFDKSADDMPVYGTIASQFNDHGTNLLYSRLMNLIAEKTGTDLQSNFHAPEEMSEKIYIIPPARVRYLSEISENNRKYDEWARKQEAVARKLFSIHQTVLHLNGPDLINEDAKVEAGKAGELVPGLVSQFKELLKELDPHLWDLLKDWQDKRDKYAADEFIYHVRGKEIKVPANWKSLSGTKVPKV